jgi:hypothetical protein
VPLQVPERSRRELSLMFADSTSEDAALAGERRVEQLSPHLFHVIRHCSGFNDVEFTTGRCFE